MNATIGTEMPYDSSRYAEICNALNAKASEKFVRVHVLPDGTEQIGYTVAKPDEAAWLYRQAEAAGFAVADYVRTGR